MDWNISINCVNQIDNPSYYMLPSAHLRRRSKFLSRMAIKTERVYRDDHHARLRAGVRRSLTLSSQIPKPGGSDIYLRAGALCSLLPNDPDVWARANSLVTSNNAIVFRIWPWCSMHQLFYLSNGRRSPPAMTCSAWPKHFL